MSTTIILGSTGMLGSAIKRALAPRGVEVRAPIRMDLDLLDAREVDAFFDARWHDDVHVYLCAATVGGIARNIAEPWRMLDENLTIQQNVLRAFRKHCEGGRLLFVGSSCMYPRDSERMRESDLLTGPLEPTNEPYAIAKIAGVIACRHTPGAVVAVLPNLFGPGDNFALETSHVVAGIMRRMHEAKMRGDKTVTLWGTGKPVREFLHCDDAAKSCIELVASDFVGMRNVSASVMTIETLAAQLAIVTGWGGAIEWDTTRPDGFARKSMAFHPHEPRRPFIDQLRETYRWFCDESMRGFDRKPRLEWRRTADDVTEIGEMT